MSDQYLTMQQDPDLFESVEEVRSFVFHLEGKYGNGVAKAFVSGRLRSGKYLDDEDKSFLEEKQRFYKQNS